MAADLWVKTTVQALEGMPNVTLRTRCMVAGVYDHGYVLAEDRVADHTPGDGRPKKRLWRIRAGRIVAATGALERPLSFAGNDVPGVMLASAVRDYVVNWAVSPGDRTVVVTNNDDAYRTAIALKEAGLSVPCIVDARAMANGGLFHLRLVAPRDGWPQARAFRTASGSQRILEACTLHDTVADAVADCHRVFATCPRPRYVITRVFNARAAAEEFHVINNNGLRAAVLFGPERAGLDNDDMACCDALIRYPLNPGFMSLNLAQAVLLVGYEWFQAGYDGPQELMTFNRTKPADKDKLHGLVDHLEQELVLCGFLRNDEKRPTMMVNLRNMLQRADLTEQEIRTLHGIVTELRYGRRPDRPARQTGPKTRPAADDAP
jgi:TrmH family RNA methyltransferase